MKRFSQKEKDDFVQGYLQSGISCTEYCKGKGLPPNSLYRWIKQHEIQHAEPDSFVGITAANVPTPNSTPNPCIEVRTKGTRIQIPASIGNEQIAFLFSLMGLAHGS